MLVRWTFFLIFLTLLSSKTAFTGILKNAPAPEKNIIDLLSKQSPLIKDVKSLKALLHKETVPLPKETKSIISNIFIAGKTAAELDALNNTSTTLFKQALQQAQQLNRKDLELWAAIQYGVYLYTYRKYEDSFPLFMQSILLLDNEMIEQVIQPAETYKKIAYFLMTAGDYEKAEKYLLQAKKHAEPNSSELASITDNLGLNNINRNELITAEQYLQEALTIASAANDQLRYGKVLGNLALIKFKQQKFEEAITLLNQDIAISKKMDNVLNTVYALVLSGKVYLQTGQTAQAEKQLIEAQNYTKSKIYLKNSEYEINTLLLEIAQKTKNDKQELTARRNLDELKKTLAYLDGKEVILKVNWEMEKKNLELNLQVEKAKRETETLKKVIAIAGCILLLLIITLLIKSYQKRIKNKTDEYDKNILRLTLDKEKSEQKLKTNVQALRHYKTYLFEKNEQIKELQAEMDKIKHNSTIYPEKYNYKIEQLLKSHLMSDQTWITFKKIFINNYPKYYEHLLKNFEKLSDSNLRIIFLSKLEMNNMEISRILGLTLDAVKKAKQRLRKKYGEDYAILFNEKTDV